MKNLLVLAFLALVELMIHISKKVPFSVKLQASTLVFSTLVYSSNCRLCDTCKVSGKDSLKRDPFQTTAAKQAMKKVSAKMASHYLNFPSWFDQCTFFF